MASSSPSSAAKAATCCSKLSASFSSTTTTAFVCLGTVSYTHLSRGCAETDYGQNLMRKMMMSYDSDPKEYARLAGFGYRMLAEAIKADLPYHISCPALLICGEKDKRCV